MNIIDKKKSEQSANIFYGVNINDKEAVQQEYARLRQRHRNITILVIIVIALLSIVIFDFYRVTSLGGKPIFAIQKKVENGTLFSGLGYKVLYCHNNGERYVGSVLYKNCNEFDERSFSNVLYEKLVNYSADNKTLDRNTLQEFTITNVMYDEDNEEGGGDFIATITFSCNNDSDKCFKTDKEFYDPYNIKLYVSLDKFNEIYQVKTFKTSGAYYEEIKADYMVKIQTYLKANQLLDEENLRNFNINILENHGKYKFRGTTYADTFLVEINYMCKDDSNTCVIPDGDKNLEGDYSNLSFYMSMFLDEENNISLMGPKEYFDL